MLDTPLVRFDMQAKFLLGNIICKIKIAIDCIFHDKYVEISNLRNSYPPETLATPLVITFVVQVRFWYIYLFCKTSIAIRCIIHEIMEEVTPIQGHQSTLLRGTVCAPCHEN